MRFSQADSTSSHAGTPWCCQPEKKSHGIIILSFYNIVKGQARGVVKCFVPKLYLQGLPLKVYYL